MTNALNTFTESNAGFQVSIEWDLYSQGGHADSAVRNFMLHALRLKENEFEIRREGWGTTITIKAGKYAGFYDIDAMPANNIVKLLEDRH